MLTMELAVDPRLRGYRCGGMRGDSSWLVEPWDSDGVDAPNARLSIDFRGLVGDIFIRQRAEADGQLGGRWAGGAQLLSDHDSWITTPLELQHARVELPILGM